MSNEPGTNTDANVKPKRPKQPHSGAGARPAQARKEPQTGASRVSPLPPQYHVYATVINKLLRVGDSRLASTVFRSWEGIHHSLHYLTDFARTSIKGRVVAAANQGITLYLQDHIEGAKAMLDKATATAENNGIILGKPGRVKEAVIEISCQTETDVLDLVRLLDDYVIVMDSLWIARLIDDKQRDAAHEDICRTVNTLHRLLTKLRQKMIDFRHLKMTSRLTKPEEEYARDLETLVFDVAGIDVQKIREASEAEAAARKPRPQPKQQNEKPTPVAVDATVLPSDTLVTAADEQSVAAETAVEAAA